MGRNFPENLDEDMINEYTTSVSASSNTDLKGCVRKTIGSLLSEIKKLNKQDELDHEQKNILNLMEGYYSDDCVVVLKVEK